MTKADIAGAASPSRSPLEITLFFSAFVAVAYAFGVYLFGTIAPEMRHELGFGHDVIGLAAGAAQAGLMASALVSGWVALTIGPMRLILGSAATITICLFGLAVASEPVLVTLLLLILGICASSVWIPMVAVSQKAIARHHQGKALGVMASGTSFGVFLNGLMVGPIIAGYGWRAVWIVAGLLAAALTVIGMARLGRILPSEAVTRPDIGGPKAPFRLTNISPAASLLILMMFLNGICFLPFQTFLTSFLSEHYAWSLEAATRSWGLIGFGGMFGGFIFGFLSDRIAVKWSLVAAYCGLLLATAIPYLFDDPVIVYAGILIFGTAYSGIFGQSAAYLSKTQETASATFLAGLTFVALGCGSMVGNFVAGQAVEITQDFLVVYGTIVLGVGVLLSCALVLPAERKD